MLIQLLKLVLFGMSEYYLRIDSGLFIFIHTDSVKTSYVSFPSL